MKRLVIAIGIVLSLTAYSQERIHYNTGTQDLLFPEKCLGIWEGTMYLYHHGVLNDSVPVRFTAARTETDETFIWKTEYLSETRPAIKDYKLVVDDEDAGRYILDEGDGIELIEYNVGNKLYCLFNVDDAYLCSFTELIGDKLIHEVTSGEEFNEVEGIKNVSFSHVQRCIMHRKD